MKSKKNEIALLIGILGVAIAIAVYVWVFLPHRDLTDAVKADNAVQREYLAKLEGWEENVEQLKTDTEKMIVDVNSRFSRFPVKSKSEDAIMYAVELESQDPDTYISSIVISNPEVVYEAAPTTVKIKDSDEKASHTYQLYRQQITYVQEFNYNGMKRYANSIVKDSRRRSIETLTVAFDISTGKLVGSTTMNLFTLEGTEGEYQKTSIPSLPMGTQDVFQSLKLSENAPIE